MWEAIVDVKGEGVTVWCGDTLEAANMHGAFVDFILVMFKLGTGVDGPA